MNLQRYEFVRKRTYKEYFFYSEGPMGQIRKIVRFILLSYNPPYYNLVLGDWDEELNDIDDMSVTNNGDTEKVLATVAAIIFDFIDIFRNARVLAEGNTPARTRRYQIGINKYWDDIEKIFYVYGYINKEWELFRKNINYNAFLFTHKEYVILEEPNEPYMISRGKKDKLKQPIYNDRTDDGPELVDINNSPFVLKKMESARKLLETSPFPEELLKNQNR